VRRLTEQDRDLWALYAQAVKPLPGRAVPAPPAPPRITVSPPPSPRPPPPRATPVAVAVGVPPAGLDTKRWTALRRGRLRPERTLDLHGHRAEAAHGLVRRFVVDAVADGARCVCIITGKGGGEGGVLRRELPHWLNAPELRGHILAAAHPHKANAGAVHLLLRRART
jgi:DNA-nicking Smr family endonuclease